MSKFLTYEDRLTIEKGLRENQSFGAIAKAVPTRISGSS